MKSELANLLGKRLRDLTLKELSEALTIIKNLSSSLSEFEKQPEQNIGSFVDVPSKVVRIVEFVDTYSAADAITKGRIKKMLGRYAMLKQRDLDLNPYKGPKPSGIRPYSLSSGKVDPLYKIDLAKISDDIYSVTASGGYTKASQELKKILDLAGVKTLS